MRSSASGPIRLPTAIPWCSFRRSPAAETMASFSLTRERLDPTALRQQLADPAAGGFASFEGWVRNHNEGLPVRHLEYEAFGPLAIREGERIIAEAVAR